MRLRSLLSAAAVTIAATAPCHAQSAATPVVGTWQVDTPDGPQDLIVRPDSSASFGDETVRWRLVSDTMLIAFGDEWVGYHLLLRGDTLTFSGGDLEEPISMVRVGPATARPTGVPLPKPPPMAPRGGG